MPSSLLDPSSSSTFLVLPSSSAASLHHFFSSRHFSHLPPRTCAWGNALHTHEPRFIVDGGDGGRRSNISDLLVIGRFQLLLLKLFQLPSHPRIRARRSPRCTWGASRCGTARCDQRWSSGTLSCCPRAFASHRPTGCCCGGRRGRRSPCSGKTNRSCRRDATAHPYGW